MKYYPVVWDPLKLIPSNGTGVFTYIEWLIVVMVNVQDGLIIKTPYLDVPLEVVVKGEDQWVISPQESQDTPFISSCIS